MRFSIFDFIFSLWMSDRRIDQEILVLPKHQKHSKRTLHWVQQAYKNQPPKFRANRDVPKSLELHRMGSEGQVGWLEMFGNDMDNSDFRERCAVTDNGKRLHRIEMKGKDMRPWHLRIENIMEWLHCSYKDAYTLSECWRRLRMDGQTVKKLVHGYVRDNLTKTKGIKETTAEQLPQLVELFETLVKEMEPFEKEEENQYGLSHADDPEDNVEDVEPEELYRTDIAAAMFREIERKSGNIDKILYVNESYYVDEYEQESDPEFEEELEDLDVDSNPFTSKELGMPEWSLSSKLANYIRFSSQERLNDLKKQIMDPPWQSFVDEKGKRKFFKSRITDKLTSQAISEMWERINARDAELKAIRLKLGEKFTVQGVSDETYKALEKYCEVLSMSSVKQAKFVLKQYIKGGRYTLNGKMKFVKKVSNSEERMFLTAILKDEVAV